MRFHQGAFATLKHRRLPVRCGVFRRRAAFEFSRALMVFEKIAQPDSADDVARVVYSRRLAAEAARVNNSRHTCCCIYFSKTISARFRTPIYSQSRERRLKGLTRADSIVAAATGMLLGAADRALKHTAKLKSRSAAEMSPAIPHQLRQTMFCGGAIRR